MTINQLVVILPVYGDSEFLPEAWDSLKTQTDPDWQLLLADDGCDAKAHAFIKSGPAIDKRTTWIRRSKNLGLFANLNEVLGEYVSDWWLLLCSDDKLLPNAIANLRHLHEKWPQSQLIISTHLSINSNGTLRPSISSMYHDQLCKHTTLIPAQVFIPALLRLGSLNGNLTGMCFSGALWNSAGCFRADWRHAADWEWLIRASEQGQVLFNRSPIAFVRTHDKQLSNSNRRSGDELKEIVVVQQLLLAHPLLQNESKRYKWAAHWLQFQLWNLFKQAATGHWQGFCTGLLEIHKSVGLWPVFIALLAWLPKRLRALRGSSFL